MATLNIEGRRVTVDDSFLKLSPAEQNATVEEIAGTFKSEPKAAAPDKYQQAAIEERDALKAQGIDTGAGYTRRIAQGATFNAADEVLAALSTPLEMMKRGTFSPREGYNYAKAREDLIMSDARKNTGGLGTALEIGGGIGSGIGLARNGFTAARTLAPNAGLGSRTIASAIDAGAMGGIAGLLEGNSLEERGTNAVKGGALGVAVGGALPPALAVGGAAISPVVSNLRARANPEGFARSQVARAIAESGQTSQELGDAVLAANRDGQNMFTLADAMGNSGQRMLSTVTRAPGVGRTDAINFLDGRQAGQSRRVANTIAEGFDAPQTAAQTERRITAARDAAADLEYSAVRTDAKPVDISAVISRIDDTLAPGVNRLSGHNTQIANDSVEAALDGFRNRLTDGRSNLTGFAEVQRVRADLADDIQKAVNAGAGNKARTLRNVLREMDAALESASPGHLAANRNFAAASRDIEAVQTGRDAAMRGRTEDTIPAFQSLGTEGQRAFRAGYTDPLIGTAQAQPFGANAARPLTSAAFADEAAAMAPRNAQMQRRIGRENTMFQTRNAAVGNSKTIENAADDAALGIDPTMVGQLLSGNWHGAVRSVIASGSNTLTGNTPAVREAVGNLLLQRGNQVSPQNLSRMVDETIARIQAVQQAARETGRGLSAGVAVTPSAKQRKISKGN